MNASKSKSQSASEGAADLPAIRWIAAADNPWGVPVLDVRPVTLNMVSTSADPQCAENAISFTQDDGFGFIGEASLTPRRIEASLRFPIDRMLAEGVLFAPQVMEHKWALFYHHGGSNHTPSSFSPAN